MALRSKSEHLAAPGQAWRVKVILWAIAGLAAVWVPWPYAAAAVLWVTFMHLALIDGQIDKERT